MKRTHSYLLAPLVLAALLLVGIQITFASTPAKVNPKLIPEDIPEPPAGSSISLHDGAHEGWRLDADLAAIAATASYTYPVVDQPNPVVQGWMASIGVQDVLETVNGLSGEVPVMIGGSPYTIVSRHSDSGEPLQKAVQYVGERFTDAGLAVEYHQWHATRPANVIGEITGSSEPEKIFILSAHLDDMPPGALAPGADDNASGSTAVLLAAETLSPYDWGCTLRFTLWTGEEQGLYGSRAYAQRARAADEEILGVLNFDMIGWNTPGSTPDIDIHTTTGVTNAMALAGLFADVIAVYPLDLIAEIESNGTGASDHAAFWSQGYPAILGIEDYRPNRSDFNPYYHTTQDRVQHLNMDYFTDFVRAAVAGMAHMSGCLVTGALNGHVTTLDAGVPIPGASVSATSSSGHIFTTITDGSGYYTITLPTDTFTVTTSAGAFLPETADNVGVSDGEETIQDFELTREPTRAEIRTEMHLDSDSPIQRGDTFGFIIAITNTGNVTLTSIPLTDTYDTDYLSYVNGQPPSDDESDDDGAINWGSVILSLPPGQHVEVITRFYAKADTSDLTNGVTENRAVVSATENSGPELRSQLQLIAPTQETTAAVRIVLPLSIDVTATNVESRGQQVILDWSTFDERSLTGFHVVRQPKGGEPAVLTETMIDAEASGAPIGANYRFVDEVGIRSRAITYQLQIFYVDGTMREMNLGSVPRHESVFLPTIQQDIRRAIQ